MYIGGDGEPANNTTFDYKTVFPQQTAQRYQAGANFRITDNIKASLEAKFTTEDAYDQGQYSFFDILIVDLGDQRPERPDAGLHRRFGQLHDPSGQRLPAVEPGCGHPRQHLHGLRLADQHRQGPVLGTVSAPTPRTVGFDVLRDQQNNREVERYVAAIDGSMDRFLFVDSINWGLSYVYGEMNNTNRESGHDVIRFQHAMDAVVDPHPSRLLLQSYRLSH